jgi:hypothetical protein
VLAALSPVGRNVAGDGLSAGDSWALLIAKPGDGPSATLDGSGGTWTIVESRIVTGAETASVAGICATHGVACLVRVAPLDRSLVRTVRVPAGSDEELEAALGLMAEAELPQTAPVWRRAGGVVPGLVGNGESWGMLTGWVGDEPAPALSSELPEVWVSGVSALAAIRGEMPWAAWADRRSGAIAVIAGGVGDSKFVARVSKEDPDDEIGWFASVRSAIDEALTAAKMDHKQTSQGSGGRTVLFGDGLPQFNSRVQGARAESSWIDSFGIALGAILVAGSGLASVRSLSNFRGAAPIIRKSGLERVADWLTVPRHAWTVIAASVAVLLCVPLGLTWARSEILTSKASVLDKSKGGREEAERRAALYQQLARDRLPITKLLADVSRACPVGVVGTSLRFVAEPPQTFSLQGIAESSALVNTVTANLASSGVFRKVQTERVESKPGVGVEFTIGGEIAAAYLSKASAEDFAGKPLAVRLFGEGASNTATAAPAPPPDSKTGKSEGRRSGSDTGERRGAASAAPEGPPAALTDADIGKMERGPVNIAFAQRRAYIQKNPGLDSTTKDRLNAEIQKLEARREQLKAAGGTK